MYRVFLCLIVAVVTSSFSMAKMFEDPGGGQAVNWAIINPNITNSPYVHTANLSCNGTAPVIGPYTVRAVKKSDNSQLAIHSGTTVNGGFFPTWSCTLTRPSPSWPVLTVSKVEVILYSAGNPGWGVGNWEDSTTIEFH